MINGLLEFSRVISRGKPLVEIDFYDVVSDARKQIKTLIEDRHAVIDSRLLPNVLQADHEQMVYLVEEILRNAIKFNPSDTPEITLSADLEDEAWRITFSDNGTGVRGKDKERVFDMFARLDDAADLPGHGVGLTVARRIAERHGGWLSCETSSDGAKFLLKLPVAFGETEPEASQ